MKTKRNSIMNLDWLGFGCDLTTEKPNEKSETVTTVKSKQPVNLHAVCHLDNLIILRYLHSQMEILCYHALSVLEKPFTVLCLIMCGIK